MLSCLLCPTLTQISKLTTSPSIEDFNEWSHVSTPAYVYMGSCLINHSQLHLRFHQRSSYAYCDTWDVTPYNLVEAYRYFRETCGLSRHCKRVYSSSFFVATAVRTSDLTKLSIVRLCDNCVWFIFDYLLISKNLFDPFIFVLLATLKVSS